MGELRWIGMTDEELGAFLGAGGTGVLSFESNPGQPPFSLPVSYGYDAANGQFYFRLAFSGDGGKEAVVDNPASFVVHRRTGDGWRSTVAVGRLEEVTEMPYESVAVQGMWAVDIPAVEIFEEPREEVRFRDFRLVPDSLTGRKEVESED